MTLPENAPKATDDVTQTHYQTGHTAVRKARRFVLQGLYEWLMTHHRFQQAGEQSSDNTPTDIAARTRATNAMHTVHLGYYHELMQKIPQQIQELQAVFTPFLDRDLAQIDPIEHAILLIGTYELKHSLHVPYRVVLDEAMRLNTHFGATDAHKLINAVLHKVAADLRAAELTAHNKAATASAHTDFDDNEGTA